MQKVIKMHAKRGKRVNTVPNKECKYNARKRHKVKKRIKILNQHNGFVSIA